MIISHKYKFIFVKTRKVGGTSLEIALSKHLDKDDIVTPVSEENIRIEKGFMTGTDYKKALLDISPYDIYFWNKALARRLYRHCKFNAPFGLPAKPRKYYPHMSAKDIKKAIGDDIWNSYYKFTIERNPWDMVVSYYYFWMKHNSDVSFEEFIKQGLAKNATNRPFYTDGEDILVDDIIKYEELDTALSKISETINYPENIAGIMKDIRAKGNVRKVRDYKELYNEEMKEVVAKEFEQEIKALGYVY